MHKEMYNLIRVAMVILAILTFVVLCHTDPSRSYPEYTESACLEAAEMEPTVSDPTEAPEPRETVMPIETTPPETEPVVATEPPTEPETEPAETEPPYSGEELEMLALVIYQEAGADYCSDETRLMVGTVVMNRIVDPRFPDTMYDVITEERAYGELHWTGIVWPSRASHPTEAHAVERAYAIAERILLGERTLAEDVVFQSEYIMGEIVAYSDGLYFCR